MRNFIMNLLIIIGLLFTSIGAMENNLGDFTPLPEEIIIQIIKNVIIEKKLITGRRFVKEIKPLFSQKNYRSFSNSCKTFNRIAKDKIILNLIIESLHYSSRDNHAIFLYATDWLEKEITKHKTNEKYLGSLLHFAAQHNRLDSIQFLLDHGININFLDRDKETALHIAVRYMKPEMVALLLKNNADTTLKNKWENTALEVAKQRIGISPEIVKTLEEYQEDQLFHAFRNLFERN